MKRIAGTLLLAVVGIAAAITFAGTANAGTITYWRECAPDGQTIVYLTIQNGYLTVYVDDVLAPNGLVVTGPGTHKVEWWGYPTSNGVRVEGPDVMWDRKYITVEPSNCATPPTTTIAAPPTTSVEVTTSTAPPAPVPTTEPPTIPPDIGLTTAISVPPTLPATGGASDDVLLVGGFVLFCGILAMLAPRRRTS